MGRTHIADRIGPLVVAIPVNNEEDRIATCLQALAAQTGRAPDHIVLLLNNCTDGTAAIVETVRRRMAAKVHVHAVWLAPHLANAGHARRLALDAAEQLAGEAGVLLTTDADSRVDTDWIDANVAALRAGADAVAGWAELDPIDWGAIPLALHEDDARECAYDTICDEMHALLDPDPADPWPRHTQASGASIAVTAKAYRQAGGLPRVAVGEDRALIAALRRQDAKIRHAPECRVSVSGRLVGRAAGGMADTIRRRMVSPDPFLDDRLEPARDCARRAMLRRLARAAYHDARAGDRWWIALAMPEHTVRAALRVETFGAAWERLEAASPTLRRRRVAISALAGEQAAAQRLRDAAQTGFAAVAAMLPEAAASAGGTDIGGVMGG